MYLPKQNTVPKQRGIRIMSGEKNLTLFYNPDIFLPTVDNDFQIMVSPSHLIEFYDSGFIDLIGKMEITAAQQGFFLAQMKQALNDLDPFIINPRINILPGHAPPAVRVISP